jgi:hypothetical protein
MPGSIVSEIQDVRRRTEELGAISEIALDVLQHIVREGDTRSAMLACDALDRIDPRLAALRDDARLKLVQS